MLVGLADAGSNRLKSMHLVLTVLTAFKSTEGELYGIKDRLEVCKHSVQRRDRCIQNSVVCVEVDQRITSSKSDIIDVYKEKRGPVNLTLWHPDLTH